MLLSELKLIQPETTDDELRKKIVSVFRMKSSDAQEVTNFLTGLIEWEDLSDQARSKIFSHYENKGVSKDADMISLFKKDFS